MSAIHLLIPTYTHRALLSKVKMSVIVVFDKMGISVHEINCCLVDSRWSSGVSIDMLCEPRCEDTLGWNNAFGMSTVMRVSIAIL